MFDLSVILPSRNNLQYLAWAYDSLQKNCPPEIRLEICIADDCSTDGTKEWLEALIEDNVQKHYFEGERRGMTRLYDYLVEKASADCVMIYHADMYCPVNALNAFKLLTSNNIVSLTRVEPPLWPQDYTKIIMDFGSEPENFDEDAFEGFAASCKEKFCAKITNGAFAPWMIHKSLYNRIGGHDHLFAPSSREDTDLFYRLKKVGAEFVQTWEHVVYHLCCKGSRRNPLISENGQDSEEWKKQNRKSERNFIRKWGHEVSLDKFLHPVILPKYETTFVVKNCTEEFLKEFEPYSSFFFSDLRGPILAAYAAAENIDESRLTFGAQSVIISCDLFFLNDADRQNLKNLPRILGDVIECGQYRLGNLTITANSFKSDFRKIWRKLDT